MTIIQRLQGKKTYLLALAGAIIALAQAMGYPIPDWVLLLLGSGSVATLRAGVTKSSS
jgi:hypothetical protein